MSSAIILVNFSVPPDVAPEFTRFYHHEFLPHVQRETPEVARIRRYEEFGVGGSLRWYNKQYLTIYELVDANALTRADAVFDNPALSAVVGRFREWKEKSLRNFSRHNFALGWHHKRSIGESFSGPFFLWQLEMKPNLDLQFQQWYELEYLPLQVADIPTWTHVRRYKTEGGKTTRRLTFFETLTETTLARSLEDLRAPHRIQANYDWQQRVEPAVAWQDATSFRPIFRWPD